MTLLLDTHIMLAVIQQQTESLPSGIRGLLSNPSAKFHVSVASLWEVAIKVRLGKLALTVSFDQLPDLLAALQITLVPIDQHHVLASMEPAPATPDPFDRLLLAQCQVEGLQLITNDRALRSHALAARPG